MSDPEHSKFRSALLGRQHCAMHDQRAGKSATSREGTERDAHSRRSGFDVNEVSASTEHLK